MSKTTREDAAEPPLNPLQFAFLTMAQEMAEESRRLKAERQKATGIAEPESNSPETN